MTGLKEAPKYNKSTATGTARNMAIEEGGLGDLFTEMTEEQKAYGHLVGKVLQAKAFEQIEDAFIWFEQEHNNGTQLDYRHKMLVIFQAAECLGCDQTHYNLIRKMYLTVANRS